MLYLKEIMKKVKGFTLIEAVVGAVLIAITAVLAFEFFVYCQRFSERTENSLVALNQAREAMERVYWDADPASFGPVQVTPSDGYDRITVSVELE